MAEALHTAAQWVGCEEVTVEDVVPHDLGDPLRVALMSQQAWLR
jgi:hypothetical protein